MNSELHCAYHQQDLTKSFEKLLCLSILVSEREAEQCKVFHLEV